MTRPDWVDRLAGCGHIAPYYDDVFNRVVEPSGWWLTAPWWQRLAAWVWMRSGAIVVAAAGTVWYCARYVGRWDTVADGYYIAGPRMTYDILRGGQSLQYEWSYLVRSDDAADEAQSNARAKDDA